MKDYVLKHKPSVTDLVKLLDKPALMKWANKIGLEGISLDEYWQKSRSAGTSLHKQIEMFIANRTPFEDKAFQERFLYFFQDKRILEFEKPVETDLFTGRFDIKFEWVGKPYIADFKSNQSRIYLENKLQLAAYRMAEGCHGVKVISIPDMKMYDPYIVDFAPYEEAIRHLVSLHHLLKTL